MPEIQGATYPEHRHREHPKVLYAGGDLKGESRTVADAAEEAAAREEGFAPGNLPIAEDEAPAEATEGPAAPKKKKRIRAKNKK